MEALITAKKGCFRLVTKFSKVLYPGQVLPPINLLTLITPTWSSNLPVLPSFNFLCYLIFWPYNEAPLFYCSWKQNRLFPGQVLPPTRWWSLIVCCLITQAKLLQHGSICKPTNWRDRNSVPSGLETVETSTWLTRHTRGNLRYSSIKIILHMLGVV